MRTVSMHVSGRALAAMALALTLAACTGTTTNPGPGRTGPVTNGPVTTSPGPATAAKANPYPVGLTRYPIGQRVALPTLSGPTLAGPEFSTRTLTGRVAVVNAWATWCDPCRTELPHLARLAGETTADNVAFLGLDVMDKIPAARTMVADTGVTYAQLLDDGSRLKRLARWLPEALPGTLVLDRQGRVAARVIGVVDPAQLRPVLTSLATEPATVTTKPAATFSASGVDVRIEWQTAGRNAELTATFTPQQPGFHLYAMNLPAGGVDGIGTATTLTTGAGLHASGAAFANLPTTTLRIASVARPVPVYPDGPVTLTLPVRMPPGAHPTVVVSYATCSAQQCLAPVVDRTVALAAP